MLNITGPEATMMCHDDQLCAILKAEIDGTVHGVQAIWDTKLTTEDWEFFLIYGKTHLTIWIKLECCGKYVIYGYPQDCFVFNWYYHWTSLILQNGNGTAFFCTVERVWRKGTLCRWSPTVYAFFHLLKTSNGRYLTSLSPGTLTTPEHQVRSQELILILIH